MHKWILLWAAISMGMVACQSPTSSSAATTTTTTTPTSQAHLTAQWARSTVTGSSPSYLLSDAADSAGNVYAVGYLNLPDTWDFGNGVTVTTTATNTAILVKYNSAGTAQWAQSVTGGASSSAAYAGITLDAAGNLDVCGNLNSNTVYNFGHGVTVTGPTNGHDSSLVVQYDASGTVQWAKTLTTAAGDNYFQAITTDSASNIYVAGYTSASGTYNYGNGNVSVGSSTGNAVIVKYDSHGAALWAKIQNSASAGYNLFQAIKADSAGNVYAAGEINTTAIGDFGNSITASGSNSANNVLLVKYNPSGTAIWAQTSTAGKGEFIGLALDGSGNLYAVGSAYPGTMGFGGTVTTTVGSTTWSSLLVKYNTSGVAQWAASMTSASNYSNFYGAALDASGNVVAVGEIDGNAAFNFGSGVTATGTDADANVVIAQYSPGGTPLRARTFTSGSGSLTINTSAAYMAVTTGPSGELFAVGYLDDATHGLGNGVTVSGSDTSTTISPYNALIVKYN